MIAPSLTKVRLPNDLQMYCVSRMEMRSLYDEIFVHRTYVQHGIELQRGDCIVDVGANVGLFAAWVAQNYPGAQVHSFEPIPDTFAALSKNVALHGWSTRAHNLGLSRAAGSAEFVHYPRMAWASTMRPPKQDTVASFTRDLVEKPELLARRMRPIPYARLPVVVRKVLVAASMAYFRAERRIRCTLASLSDVMSQQGLTAIDLLKIDAEGAELDILMGIAEHDWRKIRQLVLEVHESAELEPIMKLLTARGYTTQHVVKPSSQDGLELYMVYAKR